VDKEADGDEPVGRAADNVERFQQICQVENGGNKIDAKGAIKEQGIH
jgi:hypothetical protein